MLEYYYIFLFQVVWLSVVLYPDILMWQEITCLLVHLCISLFIQSYSVNASTEIHPRSNSECTSLGAFTKDHIDFLAFVLLYFLPCFCWSLRLFFICTCVWVYKPFCLCLCCQFWSVWNEICYVVLLLYLMLYLFLGWF